MVNFKFPGVNISNSQLIMTLQLVDTLFDMAKSTCRYKLKYQVERESWIIHINHNGPLKVEIGRSGSEKKGSDGSRKGKKGAGTKKCQ